jgi:large subunit ribosomal protein L21
MPYIIQSGSKQYTVNAGQQFVVDRLENKEGSIIDLPLIYVYGTSPKGKTLQAKVIAHQKGKKIRVVKYKAKSNYHRQAGYRHYETILEITGSSTDSNVSEIKVEKKVKPVEAKISEATETIKPVKKAATIKAETSSNDDLKKIEGIGPKIEEILNKNGILTYENLAKAEIESLKAMLSEAGPRYSIHSPETWPTQAGLAATGNWERLAELQKELNGGK